jgi:RHS repeat-associated protein
VYDGWNVAAIFDGSNNTTPLYTFTWGLDLSGSQQGAGGVGGLLSMTIATGSNAGTYFPCYDGNGNVVAMVNASGGTLAVVWEYSPFGEVIKATGPLAFTAPFLFSTKFYDWETGMYYYGYRYYNPSTGRWPSRDPIEEGGGINLYGFVANNPVSKIDTYGLWGRTVHFGATLTWAGQAHFINRFDTTIATADQGVDDNTMTTGVVGALDRHMNLPSKHGMDSRTYWYNTERKNALIALMASDSDHNVSHCTDAAQAFGRGLHSQQDISAHRNWPFGGDWPTHWPGDLIIVALQIAA